jgi:hypothetical protein
MTRIVWLPTSASALRSRWPDVAMYATAVAVVGVCYSGLFAGFSFLGPLSIAAAGSALFAVAGAWLGLAQELMLFVGLAGFVVCAEVVLFPSDLAHGFAVAHATAALIGALDGGWARMLSVTPPVAPRPDLLVMPLMVSWASGFLSVILTLGTDGTLTPAVPVLGSFAAALALTGGLPGTHLVLGGVLITLLAVLGVMRGIRGGRLASAPAIWAGTHAGAPVAVAGRRAWYPHVVRRLAVACAVIAFVAGAGALAGRSVAGGSVGTRVSAASLIHAPLQVGGFLSPMVALRGQLLAHSPRPLFKLQLLGGPGTVQPFQPLRIRVASFGHFNGVLWTSRGTFPVTGGALVGAPTLAHPVRLTEHILIVGTSGPYLPVVGWPLQINVVGPIAWGQVGYESGSGTLVTSGQLRPGLSYDVIAETTTTSSVPANAKPGPLTILGADLRGSVALSQQEGTLVRRWIAGQRYPYLKLQAIARRLRALPYTLKAPPGESTAAMRQLLSGAEPADDGYDEQHVAAFTLIAQWLGYPARIAVGYLAPRPRDGVYTVTAADARAWSEVYFTGYGWVPFDPTYPILNHARKAPRLPEGPALAPGAASSPTSPTPAPTPVLVPSASPVPQVLLNRATSSGLLIWLTAVAGAALAAAGLWVTARWGRVAVAKARLRARRRRGTPSQQVTGAWQEAMDRLTELGAGFTTTMTASDMVGHAQKFPPADTEAVAGILRALAVAQTRAVFAPGGCEPGTAVQAWRNERRLVRALYPRRLSWRRLRALFDPRPVRGLGGSGVSS